MSEHKQAGNLFWGGGLLWILPALLSIAIALVCWHTVTKVSLDVGTPTDSWYVQDFHGREESNIGVYRWSKNESTIQLLYARRFC
jgi:hypothetical protein